MLLKRLSTLVLLPLLLFAPVDARALAPNFRVEIVGQLPRFSSNEPWVRDWIEWLFYLNYERMTYGGMEELEIRTKTIKLVKALNALGLKIKENKNCANLLSGSKGKATEQLSSMRVVYSTVPDTTNPEFAAATYSLNDVNYEVRVFDLWYDLPGGGTRSEQEVNVLLAHELGHWLRARAAGFHEGNGGFGPDFQYEQYTFQGTYGPHSREAVRNEQVYNTLIRDICRF